ncbi:hypothetical protein [Novosphingobium lindaniclasticum]
MTQLFGRMTSGKSPDLNEIRITLSELICGIDSVLEGDFRPTAPARSKEALVDLAQSLYRMRRQRGSVLDQALFGEPAWDILLDLFVNRHLRRKVSVTSAGIASGVPATTALRWLALLEERALIERKCDERDGRRFFIELTDTGDAAVAECLEFFAR